MEIINIFFTKVVDYKDKEVRSPFVAPNVRSGGGMVVTCRIEAHFEELVGKHASLGYSIYTFADYEVYPTIVDVLE